MVLLRFAPSPTGPLHLGGLRMALYNHLFAKKWGGQWILRIEDTDATRFVPGSVEGIRKALDWAGLEYDYGPGKNGPHGPYFQSERLDLYKDYTKKLLENGHAYRCFCSMDRLNEVRERLARTGSNATYDRECMHLTEEEVARRVKAGEKSVVRLNTTNTPARPPGVDMIFGQLKDSHKSLATDPILLKRDLFPTYHLASVVDDHEMGITHVLRGEEWLPSLPLHLDIYSALKLTPPTFAHLPILLNPDGTKMSKRNGDVQVDDYIRRGWEPGAVLNWLALAGWGTDPEKVGGWVPNTRKAPDSTTVFNMKALIREFDLTMLTHRNTSLDPNKLKYLNKQHLANERDRPGGLTALAERVQPIVREAFPNAKGTDLNTLERIIQVLDGRLVNLKEIPIDMYWFWDEPDWTSETAKSLLPRGTTPELCKERLQHFATVTTALRAGRKGGTAKEIASDFAEQEGGAKNARPYFMIARWALTGTRDGPALHDIIDLLGWERTDERLQKAIELL